MNKKLERQLNKIKWLSISAFSLAIFLLIAGFVFLSMTRGDKEQVSKPTVALVNEDVESTFNKNNYHFGKDFVNLVSADTKCNWQVVSRSVADRAYLDQSVDAVIYIPQSFSHDILTLQDINPTQSKVNYKLQNNQSTLSQTLLDDKISDILYDFNKSIVKMYYISVANNISEAQNNMNDVILNQGEVLTKVSDDIYGPFQVTNQNYSSVISNSSALKSMNQSWIDSQNNFTKSAQSLLEGTSQSFNNQLPSLQNFFDTQREITDINLQNGNLGLINQSNQDHEDYFKQFEEANLNMFDHLSNFYNNDSDIESGVLLNLRNQVQAYNEIIKDVRDDLEIQLGDLTNNRDHLLHLENELYKQFFAQSDPGVNNLNFDQLEQLYQTKENSRHALAQKLLSSFGEEDYFSSTGYMDTIHQLLSKISWEHADYKPLFDALTKNGADTSRYEEDIDLISRFGKVSGVDSGQAKFQDAPNNDNVEQSFEKTIEIVVPAGKNFKLRPIEDSERVLFEDSSTDSEESKSIVTGNSVVLYNKNHEVETSDGTIEVVENENEAIFKIVYKVSMAKDKELSISFGWGEDDKIEHKSTSSFSLYPANEISEYLGGERFGEIAQLLSDIELTAQLIAWSYGSPGCSIQDMLEKLPEEAALENFTSLAVDSIYNRYGNLDRTLLEERLSDEDVNDFFQQGHENIEVVINSIKELNSSLDMLKKDQAKLNQNLPDEEFSQNIKELEEWYKTTQLSILQQQESWRKNDSNTLSLKSWQEYGKDDIALYQDRVTSDTLYKTISDLSKATSRSAEETGTSAQMIKGNQDDFNQMIKTTEEVKDSAEKLLKNTDSLLNSGNSSLQESQLYNENFRNTLANTRDQNADKDRVFNFFAQPLSIKNLTTGVSTIVKNFDWRWVIVLTTGLLLGVASTLMLLSWQKKRRSEANMSFNTESLGEDITD